jgi:hypothetical protein
MININHLETSQTSQAIFDNFNSFILSEDRRVFNKLVARTLIYNQVKDIPGDIVECGIFKGTGLYTFLKLKNVFNPNSSKKVIGFDFFDTDSLISSIEEGIDKEAMGALFEGRNFKHDESSVNVLYNQLISHGFQKSEFELIQGDISITSKHFSESNPGFKISLLYMDLDLEQPTYDTLNNLWDRVVPGGVVIFDEHTYHSWSESNAVDRFVYEKKIILHRTDVQAPTAYIIK